MFDCKAGNELIMLAIRQPALGCAALRFHNPVRASVWG